MYASIPLTLLLSSLLALLPSHSQAATSSLCLRTCYNRAVGFAPAPCNSTLDLNDHENKGTYDCVCSKAFIDAAVQCGNTNKCSDLTDAAAAAAEVQKEVQENCDHIAEHWDGDKLKEGHEGHEGEHEGEHDDHDHDHDHGSSNKTTTTTAAAAPASTTTATAAGNNRSGASSNAVSGLGASVLALAALALAL
ncbi:hypothetical protein HDV05_008798 [Chytridiales sp. JEL 0842]|nr:hypothetical protein HDV05_008798 [Chytridiales sp. JEL 0842]